MAARLLFLWLQAARIGAPSRGPRLKSWFPDPGNEFSQSLPPAVLLSQTIENALLCTGARIFESSRGQIEGSGPRGTMQLDGQDRRTMRRFDMRLPAVVRLGSSDTGNEIQTETQNVSARGVFFYLDRAVQ